jgi:hypothetical protein
MQGTNFKAGEFFIDTISFVNQEGESVDITKMCLGFRLYESIYKKFCTGEVGVLDGLNLLRHYKFTGQEFLRISIKQKEGVDSEAPKEFSIDKTFRIYKVDYIERPEELVQTYKMRLCDPRMFYARRKRISQTLRGSYDQMIQRVLIDEAHFRPEEFDQWVKTQPENKQFISPNWTVDSLLTHFVNVADTGNDDSFRRSFFFYQTLNGGFRFTDFTSMCKQEFPLEFSYKPRNADLETDQVDINAEKGLNTQILAIEKPQMFDTLRGTVGGAYASTLHVYDPIRKLMEDNIYDMDEVYKRSGHVSGYPMMRLNEDERVLSTKNMIDKEVSPDYDEVDVDLAPNKEYNSLVKYSSRMVHAFDDATDPSSPEVFEGTGSRDNSVLERQALLEILQQNRIVVTIPLRTDLQVGMIVKLLIPTAETDDGNTSEDRVNDDRYLITDLAISGNPLEHTGTLSMECVKESYARQIEKESPLKTKSAPREETVGEV